MTLKLGASRKGRPLKLTDEQRSRHIHIVGASGTGKSKLLESMVRQDILAGRGLCLIDPHGTLSDAIVEWCAAVNAHAHRRIHIVDLKNEEWSAGFNPLGLQPGQDIDARVDAAVATCAEVWGGEDLNQTPLLATCLQLLFHALAANQLTLVESIEMTSSLDPQALRQRLTAKLENPVYGAYWRDFLALPKRDFEERFSSTRRRLLRFLGSPTLRRVLGQRTNTLNVREIMDRGEIMLVNLAPKGSVSAENGRLLGALLMSELRLAALARDPVTSLRRPFGLYVDECYDYLTGDVERMLDETRKFGLHVILAHQRLGQLKARSAEIYNGVMAGGQSKIVFGGMSDEDAEIMAREIYRSSLNLERPKHVLDKPIVVDELPYWLESASSTEAESTSWSETDIATWSETVGSSESSSQAYSADGEELGSSTGVSSSSGMSFGGGSSSTRGGSTMSSQTQGRSQTLKPVRVTMPTAVHSLEEELHLAIVKLRELPNRAAILKRRGHVPVRFRPDTVRPAVVLSAHTERFLALARSQSPYILEAPAAEREIAARRKWLTVEGDEQESAVLPTCHPFWVD